MNYTTYDVSDVPGKEKRDRELFATTMHLVGVDPGSMLASLISLSDIADDDGYWTMQYASPSGIRTRYLTRVQHDAVIWVLKTVGVEPEEDDSEVPTFRKLVEPGLVDGYLMVPNDNSKGYFFKFSPEDIPLVYFPGDLTKSPVDLT